MNKSILKKYLEGRSTPEEALAVEKWIESPQAMLDLEKDFFKEYQRMKVKASNRKSWKKIIEKVQDRIQMEELYESLKRDVTEHSNHQRPEIVKRMIGGRKSRKAGFLVTTLLMAFLLISLSIIQFHESAKEPDAINLTEIVKSTKKGQKLNIRLSDGTKIRLNAASKITYYSDYGRSERTVHLEGEAFFDVAHDENLPFKIVTGNVVTTALGTSFNINSLPGCDKIMIALVTGKVTVEKQALEREQSSVVLGPGDMAIVRKSKDILSKLTYDYDEVISWKNDVIYLKDANYHETMRKLGNWYGVNIHSNKKPDPDWKFSGKFKNESLENILNALKYGHKLNYEINGKDVQIKF